MPSTRRSAKPALSRDRASSSFEGLRAYLTTRADLAPGELDFILGLFVARHLEKGDFLQRPGDQARQMAFVARGCLRSYVIDGKGKVHIVRFAPEDWWLADSGRFLTGESSRLFIDAVEPSDVLLIDPSSHQRAVDRVAAFGAAYRAGLQRLVAANDRRIISSLGGSARDRYLEFVALYPNLGRRVPLGMLASYLGMSPETLSRVRRSLSKRRSPLTS